MNKPLLSICIPTYENPEGVRSAIEAILIQCARIGETGTVEFCISDNSENDRTQELVTKYIANGVAIKYNFNGTNVGYDRNVDRVISLATGEYIWLLSDNENLKDDALSAIINTLRRENGTDVFIIVNEPLPNDKIRSYRNMEEVMRANTFWIPGGLVSSNIIKRSSIPTERSQYFGNDWLHLSIMLPIAGASRVTLLPNLFSDGDDLCRWAKNGKAFHTFVSLSNIISNLSHPPYSEELLDIYRKRFSRGLPRQIASARIQGLRVDANVIRKIHKVTRGEPLMFALSLIVALCPISIISYAKKRKNSHH